MPAQASMGILFVGSFWFLVFARDSSSTGCTSHTHLTGFLSMQQVCSQQVCSSHTCVRYITITYTKRIISTSVKPLLGLCQRVAFSQVMALRLTSILRHNATVRAAAVQASGGGPCISCEIKFSLIRVGNKTMLPSEHRLLVCSI